MMLWKILFEELFNTIPFSLLYFLMFTEIYCIWLHLMQLLGVYAGRSKNRNQGFYYLYLEAVSIQNSKSQSTTEDLQDCNPKARPAELLDLFSFSSRDLEFIVKFSKEHGSDLFRQIIQSICPSIYGHEVVKGKSLFTHLMKCAFTFSFILVAENVKHEGNILHRVCNLF